MKPEVCPKKQAKRFLSSRLEIELTLDTAGDKVVDDDFKVSATDNALNDSGKFSGIVAAVLTAAGKAHFRAAADNLGPGPSVSRSVVAVAMLVGGDYELTAGGIEKWSPQLCACALPIGEVGAVLRILVGRSDISWIMFRIVVK